MKLLLNSFLRLLSTVPKLYLSIYLLKVWDLVDVGRYNLLNVSITLSVLVVGLDFYSFSNREITKAKTTTEKGDILINQLILYVFVYAIFIPIFHFIFSKYFSTKDIEVYLIIIIVSEHLSQEIYRLLNVLELQITASILLALRSVLWIFFLFFYTTFINDSTIDIKILFKSWCLGAFLSVFISFLTITTILKLKIRNTNISNLILFYKKSLKVVKFFLIITILYKSLEYSGRYMIALYYEPKILGVYSIFYQFSNLVTLLFDSTIITFLYPKLLRYFNNSNFDSFQDEIKSSVLNIVIFGFAILITFYVFRKNIYTYLNKPELENYDLLLIILTVSNLLYLVSSVYHYALYSIQDDKGIFIAVLLSAIFNISTYIFIPFFDLYGVAVGGCLSYLILLSLKYFYYKRHYLKYMKTNGGIT